MADFTDDEMLEALKAGFARTPLHQLLQLRMLEAPPGATAVEMPVAAGAMNQSGNFHGGAIATLVDVACGSAAARSSSFVPGENTIVTADLHVRYLGRPKGDAVRADARVVRSGRQLVVVECRVADVDGNVIAMADFAAMVVPLRQPLPSIEDADVRAPDL